MREYGQIQSSFWTDPDTQQLSDHGKLLAAYLLTGQHSNGLGCFRLPYGYIQADFGWQQQIVTKAFSELFDIGFVERCEKTEFVLISSFLKWNPISNGNVAAARVKEFVTVPKKASIFISLCKSIKRYGNHLPNDFETLLEGYVKQEPTLPYPTQREDTSTETVDSVTGDLQDLRRMKDRELNLSARRVLTFLNEKTGRQYPDINTNLDLIKARLKEGFTDTQLRQVVAKKTREWESDEKMNQFLRPATLFGKTNFAQYVGELVVQQEAQNG